MDVPRISQWLRLCIVLLAADSYLQAEDIKATLTLTYGDCSWN